jgi:hypothetical protein
MAGEQHAQVAYAAPMWTRRQVHEEGRAVEDAVAVAVLMDEKGLERNRQLDPKGAGEEPDRARPRTHPRTHPRARREQEKILGSYCVAVLPAAVSGSTSRVFFGERMRCVAREEPFPKKMKKY